MPVVACKLLTYKGQYRLCHIKVPDVDVKLSAIEIDSQCYSLFRRFDDADAAIKALDKLAQQGGEVLALTKQKSNAYVMWALELEADILKASGKKAERSWPIFGPASCLILGAAQQHHQCYVQVPDLAEPVVAVHYESRFYSVYQTGLNAVTALDLATQFARRGTENAIASTSKGYAVCLWEPEAKEHQQSNP
ncbi:MAG: hypothetical protein AAF959_06290 [Cyanobacteria bacterium P01_D01_bin.56]